MELPALAVFQQETHEIADEKDMYRSITNYPFVENSRENISSNMPGRKDSVSFAGTSDLQAHSSPRRFAILFSVTHKPPGITRHDNLLTNVLIVNCFFARSFAFHTFMISNVSFLFSEDLYQLRIVYSYGGSLNFH